MNPIPFSKYQGLGNDFILIDAFDSPGMAGFDWRSAAPTLCNRRLGIGADGILVMSPPDSHAADLRLHIINADGSAAQLCGNGIRCVAAYMATRRHWSRPDLLIHTDAGVVHIRWASGATATTGITVNMGVPRLAAADIPVLTTLDQVVNVPLAALDIGDGSVAQASESLASHCPDHKPRLTCVSFGNPHAVFFVNDPATVPLEALGPVIEKLPIFPQRINVHVAAVRSRRAGVMRAWERGSGLTQACGSGACAVLVAGVLTGLFDDHVEMTLPGGVLDLTWQKAVSADRPTGVFMSGPAVEVYRGECTLG
ncbi:MAG: Diaminopimelate epimerase [Phycisphaerales bacterium]|nr:Diaminopimelate epimerase [Phycisphaerales bacterium]